MMRIPLSDSFYSPLKPLSGSLLSGFQSEDLFLRISINSAVFLKATEYLFFCDNEYEDILFFQSTTFSMFYMLGNNSFISL